MTENENTITQNLWDSVKAVLRGMIFSRRGQHLSSLDISPTSKKTFTSAVPFLQALPGPSASALTKLFNLRSASVTTRTS